MTTPLDALVAPLAPLGDGAWAVGGGVRDALLGRRVADLDVAVAGDAAKAAAALCRAHGGHALPALARLRRLARPGRATCPSRWTSPRSRGPISPRTSAAAT